jgi:peptide/nickel transport system ATP-binding protein
MAGTGKLHLREASEVLLRVEDLVVEFPIGDGHKLQAVSGISFDVAPGETLGLVGESGCGKSTTGRAILQMPRPTAGSITFDGVELTTLDDRALRGERPQLQMIFQDPISSINPRRKVKRVVGEGLSIWKRGSAAERKASVASMLTSVGLDPSLGDRWPHQLSGGQSQRVCIARVLALEPRLIVCDEPVSALDVSVQAQILNLLEDMKERYGLTLVFIAHDLAVVNNVSDRILVMYLGKICEIASAEELHSNPAHPYTSLLLESIPEPKPISANGNGAVGSEQSRAAVELPSPLAPPSGCRFRTRCPRADARCADEEPQMRMVAKDHYVACHHPNVTTSVELRHEPIRSGT